MSIKKVHILLSLFLVLLAGFSLGQPINSKPADLKISLNTTETEQKTAVNKIDLGIGFGISSHLKDNSNSTDYSGEIHYYSFETPSVGLNYSGNFSFLVFGRYFLTPNFAVGLIYTYQQMDESKSIFGLEGLSPSGEFELTGKGLYINIFPGIQFIKGSRTSIKAGLIYKSFSGSGTFPPKSVTAENQFVNSYTYTLKPGFAPFLSGGFEFVLARNIILNLEVFGEFASTSYKTLKIDALNIDSFGTSIISDNQVGIRFSLSGGFDI